MAQHVYKRLTLSAHRMSQRKKLKRIRAMRKPKQAALKQESLNSESKNLENKEIIFKSCGESHNMSTFSTASTTTPDKNIKKTEKQLNTKQRKLNDTKTILDQNIEKQRKHFNSEQKKLGETTTSWYKILRKQEKKIEV